MFPRISGALLALLLLAAAALPAAAQGLRASPQISLTPRSDEPRAADYIVAVVNSEPITNNEVRTRLLRYEQQLQQQGQALPPRPELARQVLERLINEKAQLQLAKEEGIKVDDALVDQAERNFARSNGLDVQQLRARMRSDGVDPAKFRDDLRSQITLQRLRERELDSHIKVTEFDIDQYLQDARKGNDLSLLEMNLAHILVAVPENASEAQVAQLHAKAERALARVRAGEDFAKVAAEMSDAAGASTNGGQIGMRTADRLPPLFVDAVKNLPVGGIAPIIRSAAGFHIVKVVEKQQAGLPGASVVQTHARHILLRPGPQLTQEQARDKLLDFKRRVETGGADFAQLAREFSQDASAKNGGDLGWSNPGLFVPEFEEVLDQLKPGEISDPVFTRYGVHLVQLLERRRATLSEREQREIVRNLVREKKLDEAYATWAQEVRGRAFVEFREPPS
jgi:peptidyl-prolyl cis-trans isomerase SurA